MRYAETGFDLEIDLTRENIERVATDPRSVELYLGGQGSAAKFSDTPALSKMHFDESAMLAAKFAKRMQRLDRARALRPARTRARRERNHGDFATR